ncbi:hypothetical protein ACS6F6_07515 [Enterobacter hormaechei subsp. steigerwaltii]|uniref:hypothetical protein n=1 Tax=Enterobacter hormaechei TaxID=158836 RepID=UPI003F428178
MSNIDKQAGEGDVSPKTYFIHPAAFGSTKNPGYGHVAVVKAEDFEKLRAKLEAAEKRVVELEARMVKLPERYEVDMCPTPSPNGEWFSREDVLAALVSADVSYASGNGKGE